MSQPIVFFDREGFHVWVNRAWHHGLTRDESRRLLLDAGLNFHDAYLLAEFAPWWPDPLEVEYKPTGRRRWTVAGRPVTREGAMWPFRDAGLTFREIAHVLRMYRLCAKIDARLNHRN
jgi:hypothetical protein